MYQERRGLPTGVMRYSMLYIIRDTSVKIESMETNTARISYVS